MSKPPGALVVTWRDLANEGSLYVEIQRLYPDYTVNQIRHYCLGSSGQKLPGPVQKPDRWDGHNVWLQGEKSPHAELSTEQANAILDDWDEEAEKWTTSGAQCRILRLTSANPSSAIHHRSIPGEASSAGVTWGDVSSCTRATWWPRETSAGMTDWM